LGREALHRSVGADEELLEVPSDVTRVALGVGRLVEFGVDGVLVVTVDVDLLEERERHAVRG
jgi:hypothetical protein